MAPVPFEIYEAFIKFGKAEYPRPCVILTVGKKGNMSALPISSAMELYRESSNHFRIDPSDPDFTKTGLKRECYVSAEEILNLELVQLIRKRGQFDGELLKRFKKWIV